MTAARRTARIFLGALIACALMGCSGGPIAKWQDAVEHHVIEHAQGDMNALRTASPEGDRFDFVDRRAKLTEMFPSNRRDVHALVLGRTEVQDHTWQVFLLGVVHYSGVLDRFPLEPKGVDDIRLALARVTDAGTLAWIMSKPDDDTIETYLGAQDGDPAFPTPRDMIEVEIGDAAIRAIDANSGATWSIELDR